VVKMSEEKPEASGEKPTLKCPHCGAVVDHLLKIGRVPIPQCPECKKTISKKMIPEGFPVEQIEAKPKAKPKPKAEEPTFIPRREIEEEGLFPKPKPHYVILEETLRIHRLKEDFIQYAVDRAKRTGGIHPNELWNLLTDLNSGIKSKAHAKYIVEDYYAALQKEAMKARDMGMRISYPISLGGEPFEPSYPLPPVTPATPRREPGYYGQRYPVSSYPATQRPGYGYGYPPQQLLTPEQVAEMINKALEKKRTEDQIQELRERTIQLESKVKEMVAQKFDEIKKLIEEKPSGPIVPPNVVTAEQLMEILEKKDKDAYIKYLEQRSKDQEEFMKRLLDKYEKTIEELRKKAEKPVISTQGYQRDEVKLLADLAQAANLSERRPLREIRILLQHAGGETVREKAPKREKVEGEGSIYDYLPEDLVTEEG